MSEMLGRYVSQTGKPLNAATEAHADTPTQLELSKGGNYNDFHPHKPKVKTSTGIPAASGMQSLSGRGREGWSQTVS